MKWEQDAKASAEECSPHRLNLLEVHGRALPAKAPLLSGSRYHSMEETDKRIGGLAVFGDSPTEVCQWEQDCVVSV